MNRKEIKGIICFCSPFSQKLGWIQSKPKRNLKIFVQTQPDLWHLFGILASAEGLTGLLCIVTTANAGLDSGRSREGT